ncbi:hypothetical protein SynPROS91_02650 [Synechococcus sp. PROS-9-1]|nr:hypothetical protein SynPROS91_02650 [Synechococcus sp. PROS-9-1]
MSRFSEPAFLWRYALPFANKKTLPKAESLKNKAFRSLSLFRP